MAIEWHLYHSFPVYSKISKILITRAEREQGMIEYSSLGGKSGGRIISERVIVKINGRFGD